MGTNTIGEWANVFNGKKQIYGEENAMMYLLQDFIGEIAHSSKGKSNIEAVELTIQYHIRWKGLIGFLNFTEEINYMFLYYVGIQNPLILIQCVDQLLARNMINDYSEPSSPLD